MEGEKVYEQAIGQTENYKYVLKAGEAGQSELRPTNGRDVPKPRTKGDPIPEGWGNGDNTNGEPISTGTGRNGTAQEENPPEVKFSKVKLFNRVQKMLHLGGRGFLSWPPFFAGDIFSLP
jgi:hypothetical protein